MKGFQNQVDLPHDLINGGSSKLVFRNFNSWILKYTYVLQMNYIFFISTLQAFPGKKENEILKFKVIILITKFYTFYLPYNSF